MATSWGELGDIQRNRGNWDEAERLYQQCLEVRPNWAIALAWQPVGESWDISSKIGATGMRRSVCIGNLWQLRTELGDRSGMATSWGQLGDIQRNRGNWDEAERLYQQSLALRTELGDRSGMASSWGSLGDIQRNRGNWDEAERLYQQSLN